MTPIEIGIRLFAGVALIGANAYFVAIEFALTRARQFSEAEFVGDVPALKKAWEMTNNLEIYLTTCQVGITASSIAVGIVAEPALAALFEPYFANTGLASIGVGSLLGFVIINLLHLTHGEQTPTYLGVERSRQVCRYGAGVLYWFNWIISPVITLGDGIAKATLGLFGIEMTGAWLEMETDVLESRSQLRAEMDSLLTEGELPSERREEVLNALDIDEIPVSEIIVPAAEIVSLSTTDSDRENLERVRDTPHTRFPLVGESLTDFHGIVYAPSIIDQFERLKDGTVTFADIAAPPMTLAADTTISDAFDQFQTEGQELALVLDNGDVAGLLTATDALEAVMGELEDPLDE
ncbi:hemolysin family protein [Halocatena halophila]|uniref:hemolysin family protein n=1 Tax=Halocatena halophila TaxID=2814576 RepID=UPI002ED607D6